MMDIKRVKGYEDYYLIDTLGNVVSLPREYGKGNKKYEYRVLGGKVNRNGYREVILSANG